MNGSKRTTDLIRTTLDWLHSTTIKVVYHDPFLFIMIRSAYVMISGQTRAKKKKLC